MFVFGPEFMVRVLFRVERVQFEFESEELGWVERKGYGSIWVCIYG